MPAKMLLSDFHKVSMSPKRASFHNSGDKDVSRSHTDVGGYLRIRIIKLLRSGDYGLQGLDLPRLELGEVYKVGPRLAELLIVCGYAEPEMPLRERAADQPATRKSL
jgi:hypothetical protein